MAHDQLFKELLQAFFREFMELFFPAVADRLDFSRITFLDKETFTDVPEGDQREADLVAQVYTLAGEPELIVVHIEVEAQRKRTFSRRMFEYYMLLVLRYRLPIYPVVIYLSPGAGGLTTESSVDRVFDEDICVFNYKAVGLPDLNADDYQSLANPLGPALSALMKTSRLGRVAQKYQSLRAMALSRIDDARKALLTNVVETYLPLAGEEQLEFEMLIVQPDGKDVQEMISVYEQRGIDKGFKQGVARGKRESLLRMMRQKFGDLSEEIVAAIGEISDVDQLDRLLDRLMTAATLNDMKIASA